MRLFIKLIPLIVVSLIAMMTDASASLHHRNSKQRLLPRSADRIVELGADMAPIAYVRFCLRYGDQCDAATSEQRVVLTEDFWAKLKSVNSAVNGRIHPNASKDGFSWSLDTAYGNCNDYAVQKREALLRLGLPMAALSLAVVRTPSGEGHLVLTVRTDRGDYVLDNLRPRILAWNHTGYDWLKVQSAANPNTWMVASNTPVHQIDHPVVRVAYHHPSIKIDDVAPRLDPLRSSVAPNLSASVG